MSSSAALEVATAMAIRGIRSYKIAPMDLAKLCRRAENDFVGMGCGIMDQFSAIYGSKNAFLFLDCLKLAPQVVDTDADWATFVVCESTAPRELLEGKYDVRRKECSSAAKKLGQALGRKIRYLRGVSAAEFQAHGKALAPNEWKRANHIIQENARVLEGLKRVRAGEVVEVGQLMLESHSSSRDYFENSCPELDTLIEVAEEAPGFVGGKLCGGGFGGATVNLVRQDQADVFQAKVKQGYRERFGVEPKTTTCRIGNGAQMAKVGK
jgi:galactokinase